jgi:phosphopantetheine--protein transferase-like protein
MSNLFERIVMNNTDQVKEIISAFIQKAPHEITESTSIDKTAIKSSILIHRMYAAIAETGLFIEDYANIKTFGDFIQVTSMTNEPNQSVKHITIPTAPQKNSPVKIGVDIENINNFSAVKDYREDTFYKQNFSSQEISWCIMRPSPLISFAGKFAAKEAIVKADNQYRQIPFNQLEILNTPEGKPYFGGFEITISHTDNLAVAIAVKIEMQRYDGTFLPANNQNRFSLLLWVVAIFSLILALIALFAKHQ